MQWSKEAWQKSLPVYNNILELDFIHDLMDGSLRRETFDFYIRQDSIYLYAFGKTLAGISTRLHKPEHIAAFVSFAKDTMDVERALHASYVDTLGERERLEPSPTCQLYTSFMLRQVYEAPVEIALASVLPCFRVYKEVGDHILANQKQGPNPYQKWINTYGGEEFGKAVETAIAICDAMAAACPPDRRKGMTDVYLLCTKMEWMFWDSAYKREQWPV